jgi:cyclase
MHRKDFLKSASLIAGGVLLGFDKTLSRVLNYRNSGFRELRNNVGVYTEKGGTIGWFASKDSSAVIDSQFPDSAENFLKTFKEKFSGNFDFLFNTHHHGDHTSGNYFLKEHARRIVAQENCPRFQQMQNKGKENEKFQVYADMTFKDQWQRELETETIHAQFLGAAHTGGDSIIYFEKANIAHLGDLVFYELYPFIDLAGGGSIKGWIEVLEKAADKYPADTLYIFGHSKDPESVTGNKDELLNMRDYLTALLEFVSNGISEGKSIEDIQKTEHIPGFENRSEKWEGAFAANLQAAHDELSEKEVKY